MVATGPPRALWPGVLHVQHLHGQDRAVIPAADFREDSVLDDRQIHPGGLAGPTRRLTSHGVFSPATSEDGKTQEGPAGGSTVMFGDGTPAWVSQSVVLQGTAVFFLPTGLIGRGLFVEAGHGAKLPLNEPWVRSISCWPALMLTATGGQTLVYAAGPMTTAFQVLANDARHRWHGFSCGNIEGRGRGAPELRRSCFCREGV